MGFYVNTQPQSAMVVANIFLKLKPIEWGLGTYPYPIWLRLVVGGENTVLYAEPMPSLPAIYSGYNENNSRQVNISMAHELMSYQDQLSNLLSYLLYSIKSDTHKFLLLNVDALEPEHIKQVRSQAAARDSFTKPIVIEYSAEKMQQLGVDVRRVVELVQTAPSNAIEIVFKAMTQLLAMVERLMALSPQEQGQPAPREISATEVNEISGTTQSVFSFISTGFDAYRAAKKKVIYESYLQLGDKNFRVPVMNRYTNETIQSAGFEIDPELSEESMETDNGTRISKTTVIGTKDQIEETFIFDSRDGAQRPQSSAASQTLVQLLNILQNPVIAQAVGKEKLFSIINEAFRLSGAGFDLNLELKPGESNDVDPNATAEAKQQQEQVTQALQGLTQKVATDDQMLKQIVQVLQAHGLIPPATGQAPQAQAGPPGPPQVLPPPQAAPGMVQRAA